ncbi:MAG: YfhO family protein [Flavobacteriaceae bacterium]|nr:YfhO family protein [Flavobacteriaceae bacterium]
MQKLKSFWPHGLAVIGFVIVALIYFYPVLEGKVIFQSDIAQYTGMAKEQNDFRAENNEEPYWTNSAFGGMPTYQLGAQYPHNYVKKVDSLLRFLPRPADYLFLYFLGFYILLMVLKIDPLKAFFGALAFGFSTYLVIILGVGHNAKAHAIAYFPMVLAGVLLVFQKRYWSGGILTMLAAALEIQANHFQMTYYLLILLLIVGVYYIVQLVKEKAFNDLAKILGVFAVAGILAIGANATNLMATSEYTDYSIRGKSELTFNPDGTQNDTKTSMKYDYITEYSYGIGESLNLIAPRLYGGGHGETLTEDSEVYKYLLGYGASPYEALQTTQEYGRTYWGDQPIVEAPAYIGIVVFFLAMLALFIDNRKVKYVFVAGILISLFLSWGKNFDFLTKFFVNYVPLYDKFRAVSSIQVVLELCFPILAMMGLQSFFKTSQDERLKGLKNSVIYTGGLLVALLVLKGMFSFTGAIDGRLLEVFQQSGDNSFGVGFVNALKQDRKNMFTNDLLRGLFFVLAVAGALFLYTKEKLSSTIAVVVVGLLMVSDLFTIDKKYVAQDKFVEAYRMQTPFQQTEADKEILSDNSIFRVYEVQGRLQGRTSYFHKSVGGYSAVRPRRMDELFNYEVENKFDELFNSVDLETGNLNKSNAVLDLLNVKYLIFPGREQDIVIKNPSANGNAWFVEKVKVVNSADEEMKALDKLDTKNEATIFQIMNSVKENSLTSYSKHFFRNQEYKKDSLASIQLEVYKPNYLKYISNNSNEGFAVFSEMYYKNGWKATIDGKETPIYNVNYVLRGLQIPAGKHTIEFKFEPEVVATGSKIALGSSILMVLLIGFGIYKIKED